MNTYILDACALIAYYADENGADLVQDLIEKSYYDKHRLLIHKINLLEVFYNIYKSKGRIKAMDFLRTTVNFPMEIIETVEEQVFIEAGRLKSSYKMSLADSIFLAEVMTNKNFIGVTADHHEFEPVKSVEDVNLLWFR
jgi:predicted nucleic acid-binding protein